jgi:tRNA (cmo5U34)-methyltransferase
MKILKKRGAWTFGGKVPLKFDKHIEKSVPFYNEGHDIIQNLSDYFLFENSTCYDIGCSTASLLQKISKFSNKRKLNFIGIEVEKNMVALAKKNIKKNKLKNIKIINNDIIKFKLKKNNLIISYYTIQFIHPSHRQIIFNKIYKSLNWGGGFIIFEKIRGNDARFDNILNSLYLDFKEKNNFKAKEILNKSKSIRGVLEPFSDNGNLGFIKRAGFKDIQTIFHHLCFKGYLCIK